jgi:flavin-dependent dehydrogenase
MYDAIVVGARCAGAPTAMLLARRGLRVLLVDRASFPSDTISTHYIPQAGVVSLREWGLLSRLEATGAPRILDFTADWGDFTLVGRPPPVDGQVGGFAPRRTVLDDLLVRAAVEAGAELRERFPVTGLLWENDRVVGVESHGRRENARIVVGADGRGSFVARQTGAETYRLVPAKTFQYYSYFEGVSRGLLESYRRGRRAFFVFPTNFGQACVIEAAPIEEFANFHRDPAASYRLRLELVPELAERVAAGRQVDRVVGTAALDNFFRVPHGAGWALVGDAGYHKDPQTGQGIRDAFRDAGLLADAIADGLGGRRPLDAALTDYQLTRDAAVDEIFEHTCRVVEMPEPTERDFALRAALRDNPAATALFFGIGDGTVSPRWFFSEENLARILRGGDHSTAQ